VELENYNNIANALSNPTYQEFNAESLIALKIPSNLVIKTM